MAFWHSLAKLDFVAKCSVKTVLWINFIKFNDFFMASHGSAIAQVHLQMHPLDRWVSCGYMIWVSCGYMIQIGPWYLGQQKLNAYLCI